MKLKALIITLLLLSTTFAVENKKAPIQKEIPGTYHELGGFVGFTTGNGFSYRVWHNSNAFELVLFPWYMEDTEGYYERLLVGLGLLHTFKDYGNAKVVGHITGTYRLIDANDQQRDLNIMSGLGVGVVYKIKNDSRFYYTILTGISYYNYGDTQSVAPSIDFGIHFRL